MPQRNQVKTLHSHFRGTSAATIMAIAITVTTVGYCDVIGRELRHVHVPVRVGAVEHESVISRLVLIYRKI